MKFILWKGLRVRGFFDHSYRIEFGLMTTNIPITSLSQTWGNLKREKRWETWGVEDLISGLPSSQPRPGLTLVPSWNLNAASIAPSRWSFILIQTNNKSHHPQVPVLRDESGYINGITSREREQITSNSTSACRSLATNHASPTGFHSTCQYRHKAGARLQAPSESVMMSKYSYNTEFE